MTSQKNNLRALPSVEQLLQNHLAIDLIASFGRPITIQAIRAVMGEVRVRGSKGSLAPVPAGEELLASATSLLQLWTAPTLLPVINASGVILHTNLGRAPLSAAAIHAMQTVASGYSNLEFDLETGRRGSRSMHCETLLQRLTGAEAALVVNNNAAAVLLLLSTLANKKRVIVSRSQLVEIGGGFRIPDVMRQSGARLVEIGTTNRVHLSDYIEALSEPTAMVLHAHHSNFKIIGFAQEPAPKEIADLSHSIGVIFADDLGSGVLLATERFGLVHEPTVQEALAAGSDLVSFSGDKLLGGPQAGILVGKADLLARIRKHPLARAVRVDKLCLAALAATLLHYVKDEAEREIPIWRMISASPGLLKKRARNWVTGLGQGRILAGKSTIGGGSLPGETLPTWVLALTVRSADKFLENLRREPTPVIARIENDQVLLDPRTILPEQDSTLLESLAKLLQT